MKIHYLPVATFLLLSSSAVASSNMAPTSLVSERPRLIQRNRTQVITQLIQIIYEIKGFSFNIFPSSELKNDLEFESYEYAQLVYSCETEFDISFSPQQVGTIKGDHTTVQIVATIIESLLPVSDPDPEDDEG